jgi:hypothetical protein
VKFKFALVALLFSLTVTFAAAASKEKAPAGQTVDAGTFGVFINGRRVATETFSIQQSTAGSVADSQFKTEAGVDNAVQTSQLQLTAVGDLRKYEWKEVSPGKAQAVVMPNNDFLMERATNNPTDKEQEHPFLLPSSTSILDDYFFIQREILAWKYLATGCRREAGQLQCPVNQKVQFGTLNPHSRSSMLVSLEFSGRDKVAVRGADRDLNHFLLHSDGGDWAMWLDDDFKLVRILIPSDNTEVVRD